MTDYPDDPQPRSEPTPTHWHDCPKCGRCGAMRAKFHESPPTETSPGEEWWTVHCVCGAQCPIDGEPLDEQDEPPGAGREPDLMAASAAERAELLYRELREAGR